MNDCTDQTAFGCLAVQALASVIVLAGVGGLVAGFFLQLHAKSNKQRGYHNGNYEDDFMRFEQK